MTAEVTREEFDALKGEVEELRRDRNGLLKIAEGAHETAKAAIALHGDAPAVTTRTAVFVPATKPTNPIAAEIAAADLRRRVAEHVEEARRRGLIP